LVRGSELLENWDRFKFDVNLKFDDNTNKFLESFNKAISKLRGKPILTMLEKIRKLVRPYLIKVFRIHLVGRGRSHYLLGKKKAKLD